MSGSRVLVVVLQLVAFGIIAAHLGPRRLGAFAFGIAAAKLIVQLANPGFHKLVDRDVAQDPDAEAALVPNLLYLRLATGVIAYAVLLGALQVAGYPGPERSAAAIAGVLVIVLALESARVPLEVRLRLGWPALVDVVEAVVLTVGAIVLARRGAGPSAFLWLYVVANALTEVLLVPVALRAARYRFALRPRLIKQVARTAVPLGLASLLATVYYAMDTLILARLHSAADVGQYGAAYRVVDGSLVVPGMALVILGPVLARSAVDSIAVLEHRSRVALHLMSLLAVPVAIGGALTAWRVVPALPGFARYEGAGVALALLAPAIAAIFLATLVQTVLVSGHEQRALVRVAAGALGLNLALNLALIAPFSFVGAAVATSLTEVAVLGGSVVVLRRRLGLRIGSPRLGRVAAAGAVLAVALVPGYLAPPLVQVALGIAAYGAAVLALGALSWVDVAALLTQDGPASVVIVDPGPAAAGTARSLSRRLARTRPVRLIVPTGFEGDGGRTSRDASATTNRVEVRIVEDTSVATLRDALLGTTDCHLVLDGPGRDPGAALAARLARCRRVRLVRARPHRGGGNETVEHGRLVGLLVDAPAD